MAIDRMVAQGQISEESKRGFASRETTCRSLELSMCRRMPSPTSQVIDASSPLGDIVADLIRNIRLVSVGLWPYRHPCHRIKA